MAGLIGRPSRGCQSPAAPPAAIRPTARYDSVVGAPATPPGPSVPIVLGQALGATVLDYRCRSAAHAHGLEEHNDAPSVVFVRRGLFARTEHRESVVADATQ